MKAPGRDSVAIIVGCPSIGAGSRSPRQGQVLLCVIGVIPPRPNPDLMRKLIQPSGGAQRRRTPRAHSRAGARHRAPIRFPVRGLAAGTVTLLGHHALPCGRPALVAGLALLLEARVRAGRGAARVETDRRDLADDPRLARLVEHAAAALGLEAWGFVVRVRSQLPVAAGLGTSAALAVAVLRALAAAAGRPLGFDLEFALGRRLDAIFDGHSFGIDAAAAALGTCFRFIGGEPPSILRLRVPRPLPLALALAPDTANAERQGRHGEVDWAQHRALLDQMTVVVEEGQQAVEAGDLPVLGRAFDRNHALLGALGASTPEIEARIKAARAAGALGAKLTGRSGTVVALAPEPERVAARLEARGVSTLVTWIGTSDVSVP